VYVCIHGIMARKPVFAEPMCIVSVRIPVHHLSVARRLGINVSECARAGLHAEIEKRMSGVRKQPEK